MKFDKTDHMYYKQELNKLLSQAKENDIEISLKDGIISFKINIDIGENIPIISEQSSVDIKKYINEE